MPSFGKRHRVGEHVQSDSRWMLLAILPYVLDWPVAFGPRGVSREFVFFRVRVLMVPTEHEE